MNILMDKHTTIIGETQSGKTLLANHLFSITGGLFIDIEDVGDIRADKTLTRKSSRDTFLTSLKKYKYVKYVPSEHVETSFKEIRWIWRALKQLNQPIYVYVDEIQNWGNARKNACDVFAVRGLKYGIHLVAITQKLQNVSKTICSQSPTIVFFDTSDIDEKYFKDKNLPYREINDKIRVEPKYSFVIYRRNEGVSEAFRLPKSDANL